MKHHEMDFYRYSGHPNSRIKLLYVILIATHNVDDDGGGCKADETFYEAGFAKRENSSSSVEWFAGGWRVQRPGFATKARR